MKKILFVISLVMTMTISAQDEIITTCTVNGDNRYLLNYTETQLIALNYSLVHNGNPDKHTKAYYINSKTILFLDSFFRSKKPKYFGFNIYLLTYRRQVSVHQSHNRQQFLYLVPVHDRRDTTADYSALDQFSTLLGSTYFSRDSINKGIPCYGMCDSSLMAWTYSSSDERLNEKPGAVTDADVFLLSKDKADHEKHREHYRKDHDELDRNQTQWVFFKDSTILRLAEFIKYRDNLSRFPLVGIYFGSYNRIAEKKQAHKDQTVLGFIPMRLMANKHYEPDICSYIEFQNSQKTRNPKVAFTENHGTLCPTQCPPGGSKIKE